MIEVTVGRNAACDIPVDYASTPYVSAGTSLTVSGRFGVVLLAGVFVLPLLATLRPITDNDIWWHLRAGQWIAQEHCLPETDPFGEYTASQPWLAYSWLYEVLVYGLYSELGFSGILLFRVTMCLAIVALMYRLIARPQFPFTWAIALTITASFAVLPLMTERPWLVTILFGVLTLQTIMDMRAGTTSKLHWLLPGIFVIWANAHIQFVYGLMLLGIACAAPVLDAVLGWNARGDECLAKSRAWRRLMAISLACALATLVNPYHFTLYGIVWDYATHEAAPALIRELAALEFRSAWEWAVLGLALACAFRLGRLERLSTFPVLMLGFAAFCTFRSRRDVWLMALSAAALLPPHGSFARSKTRVRGFHLTLPRLASVGALVIGTAAFIVWTKGLSEASLENAVGEVFPVQAVAAIKARGLNGPMFNDYDWGGYLMWALPDVKVSIDGRANLHGDQRLQGSANTWLGLSGWTDDPELAAARLVVANKATALAQLLRRDVRFELVHEDALAQVFARRFPQEAKP